MLYPVKNYIAYVVYPYFFFSIDSQIYAKIVVHKSSVKLAVDGINVKQDTDQMWSHVYYDCTFIKHKNDLLLLLLHFVWSTSIF